MGPPFTLQVLDIVACIKRHSKLKLRDSFVATKQLFFTIRNASFVVMRHCRGSTKPRSPTSKKVLQEQCVLLYYPVYKKKHLDLEKILSSG